MKLRGFGTAPLDEIAALQRELVAAVGRGAEDETILYGQHPPTLSRGRRSPSQSELEDTIAAARGLTIAVADRGGATTLHAPGQAIVYPIVRLRRGVVSHVTWLADAAIAVAARYGVEARFDRAHPGLWVGAQKLASIGVRVERRVTSHGLAFNVVNDLDLFSGLAICATPGLEHTSFAALRVRPLPTTDEVAAAIAAALRETARPKEVA